MLSGMHMRAGSKPRFCTMKTSFGCVCEMMEQEWTRKCLSKAGALDTGVYPVFGSERSKSARNWMFGAKEEREQRFNWPSLLRQRIEQCHVDSGHLKERKIMNTALNLIRILTVDDHPLLRKGIAALVNNENDMKLVGEATTGEEALEKFRAYRPDVTLMDIQLPGLNGIETIRQIQKEFPKARIIVLTTYTGDVQVLRAIKAGAQGYLLKRQVHRELLDTIRAVHAGQRRIPQDIAVDLVDQNRDDLTPREVDVLRLIANGNANKEIADQLSIGEASVKSYVANILSKLDAKDRAHAVTIGLKRGIIDL
jgi:two-component system, NarL family, response regulator